MRTAGNTSGIRIPAPRQRGDESQRVLVAWYADIQAILDTMQPREKVVLVDAHGTEVKRRKRQPGDREEVRWVYDDVARARRLVVKRDGAGRLIVVSYYPPKGRAVRRRRGQ